MNLCIEYSPPITPVASLSPGQKDGDRGRKTDVRTSNALLYPTVTDLISIRAMANTSPSPTGSSTARSGERRKWSTLSPRRLSMRNERRFLTTTPSTITKLTRYDGLRPVACCRLSYIDTNIQDGRPVYIEELGGINLPAMNAIIGGDEKHAASVMRRNLIVEYEKVADPRLPACSRKYGHLVETCCSIMDAKNVGIFMPSSVLNFIKAASTLSQNNYPERLGKLYIINTPWGFGTVWSVIKRFLDPVTAEKIHVGVSLDELKKQIPIENLPTYLGGVCDCGGELGCKGSDAGPWKEAEHTAPAWWEKKETVRPAENGVNSLHVQHSNM